MSKSLYNRAVETQILSGRIAVLIPCYNEELTIAQVVEQFRAELPSAEFYVFDNNSTDRTVAEAERAGAIVRFERRQGKGFVVQSMFTEVDADYYVMVDGDGTYPPDAVHRLLGPIMNGEADMVIGSRLHDASQSQFRKRNRLANRLVRATLNSIFRVKLTDILSGYRAFNRKFVKGLPLFGGGFEIETELTIKAVERGYRMVEVPIDLSHRPEGSHSKIQFVRDGFLIVHTTLSLFRDYKPLTFFGGFGIFFTLLGLAFLLAPIFYPALVTPATRVPLSTFGGILMFGGSLLVTAGLILHSIARRSQEFEYQMRVLSEELRKNRHQELPSNGRDVSN